MIIKHKNQKTNNNTKCKNVEAFILTSTENYKQKKLSLEKNILDVTEYITFLENNSALKNIEKNEEKKIERIIKQNSNYNTMLNNLKKIELDFENHCTYVTERNEVLYFEEIMEKISECVFFLELGYQYNITKIISYSKEGLAYLNDVLYMITNKEEVLNTPLILDI